MNAAILIYGNLAVFAGIVIISCTEYSNWCWPACSSVCLVESTVSVSKRSCVATVVKSSGICVIPGNNYFIFINIRTRNCRQWNIFTCSIICNTVSGYNAYSSISINIRRSGCIIVCKWTTSKGFCTLYNFNIRTFTFIKYMKITIFTIL